MPVISPALVHLAALRVSVEREQHETLLATAQVHRRLVDQALTDAERRRRESALDDVTRMARAA